MLRCIFIYQLRIKQS